MTSSDDPHAGQRLVRAGAALEEASSAVLMLHGRGASAESILRLARDLDVPGVAFLAPQAAGGSWYPHSFLAPVEQNEPYLSSALARMAEVVGEVENSGIEAGRIMILGFSQGACLSLEFAARNARRYGGVVAFTGGLIGAGVEPSRYAGSFDGTPIFIGSSDPDPHVPVERVAESEQQLRSLGAEVTVRLYPGMPHTVNGDEVDFARRLLSRLVSA